MRTLLLTQEDIKSLITVKDAVESTEKTFKGLGDGTVINPTKVHLDLGDSGSNLPFGGGMNAMPAYIGWQEIAGMKWVGGRFFERERRGMPYILGMIILLDPHLGEFVSVMDGAFITNLRTGAQAAVITKYLHAQKGSVRLGFFGAGMQCRTSTAAIASTMKISEVRVYDISNASAQKYKQEMQHLVDGDIIICDNPADTCDVDVIITVTAAPGPLVMERWVKPGTTVIAMGSFQEIEIDYILKADAILVDHMDQCLHRGALKFAVAEGKIKEDDIFCTIGEWLNGVKSLGDISNKRLLFVPIGTGAMDISLAGIAYRRALEKNVGVEFDFIK